MLERYKLIHRDKGEVVAYGDDNTVVFGGPWSVHDEEGKPYYIWIENIPEPPTHEQIQEALEKAVIEYLNKGVKERKYDSIYTASNYASSNHPRYGPEGRACLEWACNVWDICYSILNEVTAGQRQIPTVEELLAELPELVWPEGSE